MKKREQTIYEKKKLSTNGRDMFQIPFYLNDTNLTIYGRVKSQLSLSESKEGNLLYNKMKREGVIELIKIDTMLHEGLIYA